MKKIIIPMLLTVMLSLSAVQAQTRFRVLVGYTPAGETEAGDIVGQVKLAISETNTAFINSNANVRIELAGVFSVNFTESTDIFGDWDKLVDPDDGNMDSLPVLRDRYAADQVVLATGDAYPYLGNAGVIGTTDRTKAYAIVVASPGVMTGYFTFVHELVHHFGGRHPDDGGTTPYAYCHGYCETSFRTIMAGYGHCSGDPARVQYFSNPDLTFGTPPNAVAMGNAATADVQSVINNRIGIITGFSSPVASFTWRNPTTIRDDELADVVATGSISTSGTITIQNGAEVTMRCNGPVTLTNGFNAQNGSMVRITPTTGSIGKRIADAPDAKSSVAVKPLKNGCSIVRNADLFTTFISLEQPSPASIAIYALNGKLIARKTVNLECGNHKITLPANGISAAQCFIGTVHTAQFSKRQVVTAAAR